MNKSLFLSISLFIFVSFTAWAVDELPRDILSQQERTAYNQLAEFVEETPEQAWENTQVLHVLGDLFGKDTGLEGDTPDVYFRLYHSLLSHRKEHLSHHMNGTPVQTAELRLIESILEVNGRSKPLFGLDKAALDALEPGQRMLIPSGWYKHAIILELMKQEDGRFQLTIVNTGDGIEYHARSGSDKEMIIPYLTLRNIEGARLIHPLFHKRLQDLKEDENANIAPRFYEEVLPFLKGEPAPLTIRQDDYLMRQNSGVCSHSSLIAYYIYLADQPQVGHRLRTLIQFLVLHQAIQQRVKELETNLAWRRLADKALTHFASSAKVALEEGWVSPGEALYLSDGVMRMRQVLDVANAVVQQTLLENADRVVDVKLNPSHTLPWIYVHGNVSHDGFGIEMEPDRRARILSVEEWVASNKGKASVTGFYQLAIHFSLANNMKPNKEILFALEEFAKFLPLDPTDVFWSELSADSATTIVQRLVDIAIQLVRTRLTMAPQEELFQPIVLQEYLTAAKLLAVAEQLIRHFQPELGDTLPSLAPSWMRALHHRDIYGSLEAPLFDAEWEEELEQMMKLWKSADRESDFFGFADFPAAPSALFGKQPIFRSKKVQEEFVEDSSQSQLLGLWAVDLPTPGYIQWAREWVAAQGVDQAIVAKVAMQELSDEHPLRNGMIPPAFFALRDLSFYVDFLASWNMLQASGVSWGLEYDFDEPLRFYAVPQGAQTERVDVYDASHFHNKWTAETKSWDVYYDAFNTRRHAFSARANASKKIFETQRHRLSRRYDLLPVYPPKYYPEFASDAWDPTQANNSEHQHQLQTWIKPLRQGSSGIYEYPLDKIDPQALPNGAVEIVKDAAERDTFQEVLKQVSAVDMQAEEVLNAYIAQPQHLKDVRHQQLLKRLFFQGMALKSALKKDSRRSVDLIERASQFFQEQYQRAGLVGNSSQSLYFLELAMLLNDYVSFYQRVHPELFEDGFVYSPINIRDELRSFIQSKSVQSADRAMAQRLLARTYLFDKSPLTGEGAVELILSRILGGSQFSQAISLHSSNYAFERASHARRDELKALLEGPEAANVLNQVITSIRPDVVLSWDETSLRNQFFPVYISDRVILDILQGQLAIDSELLSGSADFIRTLTELFGDSVDIIRPMRARMLDHKRMRIETADGLVVGSNGTDVDWLRNGRSYRLLTEQQLHRLLGREALVEKYRGWYASGSDPELLLTELGTSRVRLVGNERSGSFLIRAHDVDGVNSGDILYVGDLPPFLQRIGDVDRTVLWLDGADSLPNRVEYTDLNLVFEAERSNGTTHWTSPEFKGYRLSDVQYLPMFESSRHYLRLEGIDDSSKRLVLLTTALPTRINSSLEDNYQSEFGGWGYRNYPVKYCVYSLLPDGTLVPSDDIARYQYALNLFWLKRYEDAADQLRKGFTPDGRDFQHPLLQLLQEMRRLTYLSRDDDPRAHAVKLLSDSMILRVTFDSPEMAQYLNQHQDEWTRFISQDLAPCYERYLSRLHWSGADLLQPDEELLIARTLQKYGFESPRIEQRIAQLLKDISDDEHAHVEQVLEQPMRPLTTFGLSIRDGDNADNDSPYIPRIRLEGTYDTLYAAALASDQSAWSSIWGLNGSELKRRGSLLDGIAALTGVRLPADTPLPDLVASWKDALTMSLTQFQLMGSKHYTVSDSLPVDYAKALKYIWAFTQHPTLFDPKVIVSKPADSTHATFTLFLGAFIYGMEHTFYTAQEQNVQMQTDLSRDEPLFNNKAQNAPWAMECARPVNLIETKLIDSVDSYIHRNSSTPNLDSKDIDALLALYSPSTQDVLLNNSWKQLQQKLMDFVKGNKLQNYQYEVISHEQLDALQQSLIKERDTLLAQIAWDEEALLQLAERSSNDATALSMQRLSDLGQVRRRVTLDELARLYATQDIALLQSRNRALTHELAAQLYQMVGEWMLQRIRMNQIDHVLSRFGDVASADDQSEQQQLALAELYRELSAEREYDIGQHPAYVSFEYFSGLLLRPEQVAMLHTLQIHDDRIHHDMCYLGAITEMIMGAGKSSVILPLFGQLIADGQRLALVVMPESLMETMAPDLDATLDNSFGKGVERFRFNRTAGSGTALSIEFLFEGLQRAKESRSVVVMSNSSIQSLYLSFLLKLKQYTEFKRSGAQEPIDEDLLKSLTYYRAVFKLLKQDATVILDEVDFIMDVYKSHHFASSEAQSIHPHVLEATAGLYALFVDLSGVVDVPFKRDSNGLPFTDAHYAAQIKPRIIEAIVNGEYLPSHEQLQNFLTAVREGDWTSLSTHWLAQPIQPSRSPEELLRAYLENASDDEAHAFAANIRNHQVRNLLAVLSEQLTTVFPLTAKKRLGVHYGPHPDKKIPWAIPYQLGQPMKGSEFGTELESMNYSIQMYLESGISEQLLESQIDRLRVQLEQGDDQEDILHEYQWLFGASGIHPFEVDSAAIPLLAEHVNSSPCKILYITSEYVLRQIKSFSAQMNANAQLYGSLFDRAHGFTGTLWNADTFPNVFALPYYSDTHEKTLQILWNTSPHHVNIIDDTTEVETLVTALLADVTQPTSLIDSGAFLRGKDHLTVAKMLLDHPANEAMLGALYYDTSNALMVLEKGQEAGVPFASSRLDRNQLIAYWDQAHTTGSDLKLGHAMRAVVTVSRHTITRDFLQAVWRLRGLGSGQTAQFAVMSSDAHVMGDALKQVGLVDRGMTTLSALLQYVELNQVRRQTDANQRAVKHQVKALVTNELFAALAQDDSGPIESADLYAGVETLFEEMIDLPPYARYGLQKEAAETGSMLQSMGDRYWQVAQNTPGFNAEKVRTDMYHWIQHMLRLLPDRLERHSQYEREISVEVEKDLQNDTENDTENENENQNELSEGDLDAWKQISWPSLDVFHDLLKNACAEPQKRSLYNLVQDKVESLARDYLSIGNNPSVFSWIPLRAVLEARDIPHELSCMFDPAILVTSNLHPRHRRTAFGKSQAEVTHMLLIQEPGVETTHALLLTHFDALEVEERILEEKYSAGKANPALSLALVGVDSGVVLDSSHPIDRSFYISDAYARLRAQIKFYRGDVSYSRAEAEALEEWLGASEHREEMSNLFLQKILPFKPTKRAMYPGSVLQRFFKSK